MSLLFMEFRMVVISEKGLLVIGRIT
ncbi:hypothetical protein MTR67_012656 [Solanum verrucosum]|uniref:Uncharacterized protein n=1 Tax=Solanum verrucosum TaxID=315347 RepID=A0AAF0QEW7_SOLVR|nr:hypothetical protein MTR67_012656 [Solanum verrucosum]